MRDRSTFSRGPWLAAAALLLTSTLASAQTVTVATRITQAVDETKLTVLRGNTHPLARPEFDRGAAPSSLPMQRMLLVLQRSADQESALETLLEQQQDASSPNFHKWLTPQQFGQQFGPSDQDIQTITSWLQSHGFQVANVSSGRTVIEFSGTAGQVAEAFHTTIHKYSVRGEEHWANSTDPQIPAALVPVVAGINTLYNFPRQQMHEVVGVFSRAKATGAVTPVGPLFTFPNPCSVTAQPVCNFALDPADFAKIYDVPNLLLSPAPTTPFNGDGVTIAVVGQSDINPNDVSQFRTMFGLPAPKLNTIVSGPDPGINGAETEADLDVEWSGAVAPNATIDLVVAEETEVSLGVDLAAQYAVDNNVAPVLSESFGVCEFFMGTADNTFYDQLWQQAAAQGISVFVSTGDSGSAVCDGNLGSQGPAQLGLSVNGISSTPYNVAVGGTDFNELSNPFSYWSSNNNSTTLESALGYIPEMTWNDTCTNQEVPPILGLPATTTAEQMCNNTTATQQFPFLLDPVGGSGGKSNCTTSNYDAATGTGSVSSCGGGYAKPSWQTSGTPKDGARDVPDVSMFASNGFNGSFYVICEADVPAQDSLGPCGTSQLAGLGGTSASTPSFAAIMALVNQATGSRQGNANYILYKLAAQSGNTCTSAANPASTCVFYDVPSGSTIAMPCASGSPNCTIATSGDSIGVLSGYATTSGYDLATGLGSVNAANLITKWTNFALTPSTTTLTLNSGSAVNITHGQSVPVSVGVTGTGSTPTGNVSLIANEGPNGATGATDGVQGFTLNSGTASGSTSSLPGGTYTVFAQYAGDGTFASSVSSPPISVTVAPEASKVQIAYELFDPNTGLQTNPNASTATFGSFALLRINVTSQAGDACPNNAPGNSGCPTGSITLTDSYNGGASTALDGGNLALNVQGYTEDQAIDLPGGTHNIAATYNGDNSFSAPTPNPTTETLAITPAGTTTSMNAYPPSVTQGNSVTLNATISAQNIYSSHAPTGTVTFYSGATQLASAALSSASVSSHQANAYASTGTSSLPHGQSTITAQYSGDASYAASTSSASTVTVLYATSMTLNANPNNVIYGQSTSVTLTATISTGQPATNAALKPTGTIYFSGCDQITGTVTTTTGQDANGNWILQESVNTTPQGNEVICASYSGDSNYAASSANTDVTVTIPGFSISLNSPSLTITAGQTGIATVTITPMTNYTSTVALSCSGSSVAGAPCSFSSPSVTLSNGASATSTLTLAVPGPSTNLTAMVSPPIQRLGPWVAWNRDLWWPASATLFTSVLVLVSPGRRRSLHRIVVLIFAGAIAFAIGCGGGGSGSGGGGNGGGSSGGPAVTTTNLTATSAKLAPGASATLTATVKASNSSSVPTGVVNFEDSQFAFGSSVSLMNGMAQAQMTNTGSLAADPGTHGIAAVYGGDVNDKGSQSGTLNIVVTGSTTITIVGQTGPQAYTGQLNVTVQ